MVLLALIGLTLRPTPVAMVQGQDVGLAYGRFGMTFYWVAEEADYPEPWSTWVYDAQCAPVVNVSSTFLHNLTLEGTGVLTDGRLVNFDGRCVCSYENVPCFRELDDRRFAWGAGVEERPLVPFRSLAVDPRIIPIGTRLYVPELDGITVPGEPPWGGFVHDGCVVADDIGGAIQEWRLDFFAGKRTWYRTMDRALGMKRVRVYGAGGRCP